MLKKLKNFIKRLKKGSKRVYYSGSLHNTSFSNIGITTTPQDDNGDNTQEKYKDTRIDKKPVDVWKEIIVETPQIDLTNIKEKIKVVETRKKFLIDYMGVNPSDEIEALEYLKAREIILKNRKILSLFNWPATMHVLIEKLCNTYKVIKVNFKGYYKTVPTEALEELQKFIDAWEKVREDEPIIDLIIDCGGKETKKDPIMIAGSPFGKWYYILGAWDKEVEIVDDLIYKGK